MRRDTLVNRYFRSRPVGIDEVRTVLWGAGTPGDQPDRALLLEQYTLYVEMADRVSARRSATNTFFLTLNTLIFTAVGMFWKDRPAASTWYLVFPVAVLVVQCFAWFWLVRSYRQLNSAKYAVVGALEERLPASPYWRAEWAALGHGRDKARYWPLTHLEQWVPLLFAAIYLTAFVTALAA